MMLVAVCIVIGTIVIFASEYVSKVYGIRDCWYAVEC